MCNERIKDLIKPLNDMSLIKLKIEKKYQITIYTLQMVWMLLITLLCRPGEKAILQKWLQYL